MRLTTEKSIEVNILRHLVNCLEQRTGNKITIISPTQNFEEIVGYDDILQGLPQGQVIALQFKRPMQGSGYVKFTINVPQMKKMRDLFPPNNVFYVLPPFPTHLELINMYDVILSESLAIDVHNVANIVTINRKTSEVRFYQQHASKEISNNREFYTLTRLFPLQRLCEDFSTNKIGSDSKYVDKDFIKKLEILSQEYKNKGFEMFLLYRSSDVKQSSF